MTKHFSHYIALIFILIAAVVAFVEFSFDRQFQIYATLAAGSGYVAWGVVHHYIHKDLYLSIVVEYVVVALLGSVSIITLINHI